MKYRILLALAVCSVLLFSACSSLSSAVGSGAQMAGMFGIIDSNTANAITKSSDAVGKAAEEFTPEQEYYIGRAVGASILSQYRPFDAKEAGQYLNKICDTIVINSPNPQLYKGYHVQILDSDEINAFATSGGHIFVTRGLLRCARTEDALAAVLAHEIAHIQLQHSLKAIRTSRITEALTVTATSAVSVATGADLNTLTDIFDESVSEIIKTMVNSGYSKSQEFDADKTALSLMADAGYNPEAMTEMLELLKNRQSGDRRGFGKTHPSPEERLKEVKKSLKNYSVPNYENIRMQRFARAMSSI